MRDDEALKELDQEIDLEKRKTLGKLTKAAWTVPAVATFGLGALQSSSAWARVANGGSGS